jgi:hypothetical protein
MSFARALVPAVRLLATVTLLLAPAALLVLALILALVLAPAAAEAAQASLQDTFKTKLCEVYTLGKQLVYIGLGIGILVVVVLSIGSRFRMALFLTLAASVVIVASTDELLKFLGAIPPSCSSPAAT